jgi:hypothetical protein
MRLRGQGSSAVPSSSTTTLSTKGWAQGKTGRHVTNIHKINVINNFGIDGRDNKLAWGENNARWVILKIVMALLMTVWFVALMWVIRGVVLPPSLHDDANSMPKDPHTISLETDAVVAASKNMNSKAEESNSIFDLSLFGNKSPSDFQLYTPHAPSCTDPLDARDVSYTLVSQLSNDRLWMVPYHCERWGNNPISIVVFTDRTASDVKSELISKGCSGESLTLQTVEKTRYDPDGTEYPVNLLRNLAMSAVRTSHVLYADVDFWPSSDLYSILSNETIREELASDSKLAAIVPVFQMVRMCREYRDCREANIPRMPENKKGLLRLLEMEAASPFDPTNHGGHGSTKYKTWKKQATATFVELPCINSNRYEPYLVFRYCSELPPFQEGFTGYGKNKMTVGLIFSQIQICRTMDYFLHPSHLILFCSSPNPKPFIAVGDATSYGWVQIFSNRRFIPRPLSAFGL